MDPNQEILESNEPAPPPDGSGREWPGASREPGGNKLRFPGEDGGKTLSEIAKRDLDAALQLLAERAQYITGATGAAIALGTTEGMVCRASAGSSAPEVGSELQVNSGLSGESVRTRQILRCDDAQADGRVNRESCEALGIASVVVMPIVDGGEVIGVFELFSDRAHAFEERDIDALERMGMMVRTALEQSAEAAKAPEEKAAAPEEPVLEVAPPSLVPAETNTTAAVEDEDDEAPILEETSAHEGMPLTLEPAEEIAPSARTNNEQEHDPGEMVRDAAERTAAAKASLLESAGLGTEAHDSSGQRFAFHMRVPAAPKAEPSVVDQDDHAVASGIGEEADLATASAAPVDEAEQHAAGEVRSRGEEANDAPAAMGVGVSGAAAAPALEKRETVEAGSSSSAETARKGDEAPPAPDTGENADGNVTAAKWAPVAKAMEPPATKSATPVARPASAEGRSRMAVSQLRRCEVCGFPISEGRQYCLDCEKKPDKTKTGNAQPKKAAAPVEPAAVATPEKPEVKDATPAVLQKIVEMKAAVEVPAESKPEPPKQTTKPAPAASKPEVPKPAAPTIEEPPMPRFMVNAPDHYESWIVKHMYASVAIAVVVVGIVVYLLSR